LPFFRRAVAIDRGFAIAFAYLGRSYGSLGESDLSAENIGKAWQLRDRASDPEKFFISAAYDIDATGNLEKAQQTCEAWAHTYPREMLPHAFLSGIIYPVFGKFERAAEEARKAVDLDPDFAVGSEILAYNYEYLGRLNEAANALDLASKRKVETPYFLAQRYDLAFLKGDMAGMQREIALAQANSIPADWISGHQAFVLAYSGHLQQARIVSGRAAELARQAGEQERAALLYETPAALREAFFGNAAEARRNALAALDLSKGTVRGIRICLCTGTGRRFAPRSNAR
jgi:tetratricopeptide (TPR) repeat protein